MTTEPLALAATGRSLAATRAVMGFAVGLALLLLALGAFAVGLAVAYDGRVLAGVTVGGVDLAGLEPAAAEARLQASLPSLATGQLTVVVGGTSQAIAYGAVGRDYDLPAMIGAAMAVGRTGGPLERAAAEIRSLVRGTHVLAAVRYDRAAAASVVAAVADQATRPAVDASVAAAGFVVRPASTGRTIDRVAALAAVGAALEMPSAGDTTVDLATVPLVPAVTTDAARQAAAAALHLVSADLTVTAAGATLTIPAATVRDWIDFQRRDDGTLAPVVDAARIGATLAPLAAQVDRPARNAGFTTAGTKVIGVVPEVAGRALDIPGAAVELAQMLAARAAGGGPATLALSVAATAPGLTTSQAQALLPQMRLLSSWTTPYQSSSHNFFGRNITIPTTQIDGYILPAGAWFDFWQVVTVSSADGYGPGGAIIDGHTEPTGALGGGICSCSTTLFNAALRAGLQIGARANHYYYIDRYPVGLDATVFKSDGGSTQTMSFRNDTPYPILIRGLNQPGKVTFQLFSVPTGRKVTLSTPIVKNYKAASDSVQYTNTLKAGVQQRVEYPTAGFDAWVTRTVTDATGAVIHTETYYSHYARITGLLLIGGSPPTAAPSSSPAPSPSGGP